MLAGRWSLQLAQTLVCQLQLDALSGKTGAAILEIGCGPGNAVPLLVHALGSVQRAGPVAQYLGTDLSPAMVSKARARCALFASSSPHLKLDFRVADACALDAAGVEVGAFDRVLANLCLMLVPDPAAALRQAARALRPGGIAAFSVWGERSHSHFFELLPKAMRELAIAPPGGGGGAAALRSNYHLGELGAEAGGLRGMFNLAGFDRVVSWHQQAAIPALCGAAFAEQRLAAMPDPAAFAAAIGHEQLARLKARLASMAEALLASGVPLGLDAVIVIARKK